jgi:hypothetical protein
VKCISPVTIERSLQVNGVSQTVQVPCGQCIACRINRRSDWALRMFLESSYWTSCSFLTLTYDDEHLPLQLCTVDDSPVYLPTLVKRDVQLFIKRLRKRLGSRKIKFFAAGEYGDHTYRPHYHAILFGVDPVSDYDDVKSSWTAGHIALLPVKDGSFNYVAGYVIDKLNNELGDTFYLGRLRPFSLCSQGLGSRVLDELDLDKVYKDGFIVTCDGKHHRIPRYFLKKMYQRLPYDEYDRVVLSHRRKEDSIAKSMDYWLEQGYDEFEAASKIGDSIQNEIDILLKKARQDLKGSL